MKRNESRISVGWISVLTISGVVALWVITWLVLKDDPDRGQAGDMFGGLNALFTGLAFAGVIVTILLQREELALQRRELEMTRDELAGARKAQEHQVLSQAASVELTVLNTLAAEALRKEQSYTEQHSLGVYQKEDGRSIAEWIKDAQMERGAHLARMKEILSKWRSVE
jgi:hypothetical protein